MPAHWVSSPKTQNSAVFVHSGEVGKCQKAASVDHSLHLLTCNCDSMWTGTGGEKDRITALEHSR